MGKADLILQEKLKELIASMGYELVGCELLPSGQRKLLRIFIDRKNGVTVDDCSRVSHQVSAMLDVLDPLPGAYTLEVSSPGIDRPLFELEHYKKYVGERVKIRLHLPIQQRKQYKGIVKQVVGEDIYLIVDDSGQEVVLPFSTVERANLIGEVQFQGTKGKRPKKPNADYK